MKEIIEGHEWDDLGCGVFYTDTMFHMQNFKGKVKNEGFGPLLSPIAVHVFYIRLCQHQCSSQMADD